MKPRVTHNHLTKLEKYKIQAYIATAVFALYTLVFIWQLPTFFYGGTKTDWMTLPVALLFSVTMFMWARYTTEEYFTDE